MKHKYQLLINKRESIGLGNFNDLKAFIESSNDMDDIYQTLKNGMQIKTKKYWFDCIWLYDCWYA